VDGTTVKLWEDYAQLLVLLVRLLQLLLLGPICSDPNFAMNQNGFSETVSPNPTNTKLQFAGKMTSMETLFIISNILLSALSAVDDVGRTVKPCVSITPI
jgi:hypothetical protein